MAVRIAEVILDVPQQAQRAAERIAYALGAQGLELRDEERGRVQIVLWLPSATTAQTVEQAVAGIGGARVRIRRVEASWSAEAPAPRRLGRRFVIVGDDAGDGARLPIRVASALSFGDGQHETTTLCVEAIERVVARDRVRSLLDVGTGTGVLAIVAGKLGVRDIVATDIDPLAREAARHALRDNGVRARVQKALPRRRFDVVVANLYFEPLIALARELAGRVAEHGTLIVSGFTHAKEVEAAFAREGFRTRARRTRARWVCLELVTRQRPPARAAARRR